MFDVVHYDPAVHIGCCPVIEHIEGAVDIDFKGRGDILRLRFRLLPQLVVQIAERRHVLRLRVMQIGLVYQRDTPVDDRFLHRKQPVAPACDQFAKGQYEVCFQGKGFILVGVIQIQVHRVQIVLRNRGNPDHLPAELLHQRSVFRFWIADDDVVVGAYQKGVRDFPFRRE